MTELVVLMGLVLVCTALVWVGADYLEASADRLAVYYGIPAIVQGAVLAGVGSSMPELVTVVLAPLLHDDFELGVATIIGSAIFNVLVIPALATIWARKPLETSRALVYKEAQFYLIAVAVFLLTLSLAVIYFPVEGIELGGQITPLLALFPLGLYLLYAFIQYEDTMDHEAPDPPRGMSPRRAWLGFVIGFVLILIGVEGLLRAAIGFGEIFGTPSFVWGLTMIAIATSLPDTFVSIRASESDRPVTSVANVFGSNVFDLLVAVPIGVLIVGAVTVDFARLAPLVGFLIVATVVVFAELRTGFALSLREAISLLVLYTGFVLWTILASLGVLPGPS